MLWMIRTNLVVFFLTMLVFFVSPETSTVTTRTIRSGIELLFVFFLPGVNLAFLLQSFFKKRLSLLEFINISLVCSLFLLPLLLTIEYTKLSLLFPFLPYINAFVLLVITGGTFLFLRFKKPDAFFEPPIHNRTISESFLSKKFLLPLTLYIAVVASIITAYYPLPDLDPYYWITEYRNQFQAETITPLHGPRPLFSSLAYIFTQAAHIDFYAYFKYILPAFLLLLIFPSALLAEKFSHPLQRKIIFFLPFASGITIIFLTLPIPQAIANIGLFFFFSFLTYAFLTKDTFFYFLGGAVLFLSFFYHEALAIPLAVWILLSLWSYRQIILRTVLNHKITALLLFVILSPSLTGPIFFISSRIESLLPVILHPHPNFLFPQYYVNIDGNQMGWGDLFGVIKYYLFYIGPPILLIFAATLSFMKNKVFRASITSAEGRIFTGIFLLFFLIAEVLPRLTGIALLPDRAWVFAGTIALFFLIPLFQLPIGKNKFFLWLIILGFSANIAAAVHINTLKKYMITDHQLVSAEWINTHLPSHSTVFSVENGKLLSFFVDNINTTFIQNPNFYFDLSVFESEYSRFKNRGYDQTDQYAASLHEAEKNISRLEKKDLDSDTQEILSLIGTTNALLTQASIIASKATSKDTADADHFYIYYAAPNPKNPYIDRPYNKHLPSQESALIFNKFPERFRLIYTDKQEKIYIWEIL